MDNNYYSGGNIVVGSGSLGPHTPTDSIIGIGKQDIDSLDDFDLNDENKSNISGVAGGGGAAVGGGGGGAVLNDIGIGVSNVNINVNDSNYFGSNINDPSTNIDPMVCQLFFFNFFFVCFVFLFLFLFFYFFIFFLFVTLN